MKSEIVETYTLTLRREETVPREMTVSLRRAYLMEMQENLTDLLPEGWFVEIREWDSPEGYEPAGLHWVRDRKEPDDATD